MSIENGWNIGIEPSKVETSPIFKQWRMDLGVSENGDTHRTAILPCEITLSPHCTWMLKSQFFMTIIRLYTTYWGINPNFFPISSWYLPLNSRCSPFFPQKYHPNCPPQKNPHEILNTNTHLKSWFFPRFFPIYRAFLFLAVRGKAAVRGLQSRPLFGGHHLHLDEAQLWRDRGGNVGKGMGKDMENSDNSGRRWKPLVKSGNLWDFRKRYGKRYEQLWEKLDVNSISTGDLWLKGDDKWVNPNIVGNLSGV